MIDHWQTETGWPIAAGLMGLESMPTKPGSPTMPVPGHDLHITAVRGGDVPPGTAGEMVLRLPLPPGMPAHLVGRRPAVHRFLPGAAPGTDLTGDGVFIS